MKRWIQYLGLNLDNELSPICGSFDIFRVDRRLTLDNQLMTAHNGLWERERKGFLLLEGENLINAKVIKYYKLPLYEKYPLSDWCFTKDKE